MLVTLQYSTEEVLDEQYCFLRAHSEKCKVPNCKHCWRMDRLKEILLDPFRYLEYPVAIGKRQKGAGK